ncbi:MAG: AMP-binding protein [Planctomycetia bacterium]|nr:AMP-binding protein [Planctomycetia bacterium]
MGAIPIHSSRKSMVQAIRTAREALRDGDLVCIFPEGQLTRTGYLQQFRPGFLSILKDTDVPLIPVCLVGLWGSIFSFERGKFFWKWPRQWPYPISIAFGKPIHKPTDPGAVRQAVEQLGVSAMKQDDGFRMVPARRFLRTCRRSLWRSKAADSTGAELTGSGLLTRSLILRRCLRRDVLAEDENRVGLLIPPCVGGMVANAALTIDRRVAVNLNYAVRSADVLNECIRRAGIRHVLTSRKVMEKLELAIDAELVYLEDFRDKVTTADKLVAAAQTWLLPTAILERLLGLTHVDPDDLITIIFTSGSTGRPKGAMLTHRNISTNVSCFAELLRIGRGDVLIGILPFFHSFGYTCAMWSVLLLDAKGAYHTNPLEPRQVGKLCHKHGGTILIATPTFLRSYLRRVEPEEFAKLNVVVTGAEKLPHDLADAFEKRFGLRPSEGYGTTELSPAVSSNIPRSRAVGMPEPFAKEGSIGKPFPGISVKVVDLDTGEDLGVNRSGMLLVTGPNVMKGYLDEPELTAEVMRDVWYVTGDVARIDEDGFTFITGRISRFAKIGGEMVPHLHVEEAIAKVLAADEEELHFVVTSVPDARKGERLVVLHTGLSRTPEEICRALSDAGNPPLWIPSQDSFCQVDEIPVLGTGKLALREVQELAREKFRDADKR